MGVVVGLEARADKGLATVVAMPLLIVLHSFASRAKGLDGLNAALAADMAIPERALACSINGCECGREAEGRGQ